MIKYCIICDKEFETYDKLRKGRRGGKKNYKRGINTVTCSKKCSMTYYHMTVKEKCEMKDIHYEKHN